MTVVRWTPAAVNDLKATSFGADRQHSSGVANSVQRAIYDSIQRLGQSPQSGRPGLEEGTKELIVARLPAYVVVYRISRVNRVEILRILHGSQPRKF